eukprot:492539-Rhodomonas_salina.2
MACAEQGTQADGLARVLGEVASEPPSDRLSLTTARARYRAGSETGRRAMPACTVLNPDTLLVGNPDTFPAGNFRTRNCAGVCVVWQLVHGSWAACARSWKPEFRPGRP